MREGRRESQKPHPLKAEVRHPEAVLREDGERGVCVGCGGEFVEGELAAGGHDVAAAGVADESGDAAFDEMFLEDVDDFGGGFVEWE